VILSNSASDIRGVDLSMTPLAQNGQRASHSRMVSICTNRGKARACSPESASSVASALWKIMIAPSRRVPAAAPTVEARRLRPRGPWWPKMVNKVFTLWH
jgi:hypothetical protein